MRRRADPWLAAVLLPSLEVLYALRRSLVHNCPRNLDSSACRSRGRLRSCDCGRVARSGSTLDSIDVAGAERDAAWDLDRGASSEGDAQSNGDVSLERDREACEDSVLAWSA